MADDLVFDVPVSGQQRAPALGPVSPCSRWLLRGGGAVLGCQARSGICGPVWHDANVDQPGWPDDWSERKAGLDCTMCIAIHEPHELDLTRLAVLPATTAWLEPRSRLTGYCVVAWRGRHVAEPYELTDPEVMSYWRDVTRVARAIADAFAPMKINLLTLGNWSPHLHTHVVPRYRDDPSPGKPISYEDLTADTPLPAEVLRSHADRIHPLLFG